MVVEGAPIPVQGKGRAEQTKLEPGQWLAMCPADAWKFLAVVFAHCTLMIDMP